MRLNLSLLRFALLLIGAAFALMHPSVSQAATCESLARLALPNAALTVETVAVNAYRASAEQPERPGMNWAGRPPQAGNPAFCRIRATLKPGTNSDIKSEIWLPLQGWNGKFLHIGSFGWGGWINYPALLTGVQEGYATAMNDTGHDQTVDGGGGAFAMGPDDKLIDYAYRANHEMVLTAKSLIRAYYGKAASKSYLVGCSLGGYQGLIAAKRYPADYDGIVAGAPPNPIVGFNALQIYPSWFVNRNPASYIPSYKYAMVNAAVLKSCAGPVGQAQGFVEEPDKCGFDPVQLQCKRSAGFGPGPGMVQDAPDCLTPDQVELLRATYTGPVNPRTGKTIFMGPAKGSEREMGMFAGFNPMSVALDMFRYAAFKQADWDFRTMDYDTVYQSATDKIGPLMHVDSDLAPFLARGGKLLFYIGWNDYHNPSDLIEYYKAVVANAKSPVARANVRLFTIPGMGHCAGGAGCDTFDKIGTLDAWVTRGTRPERIETAKYEAGKAVRTRPACAWPMVAKYNGSGDVSRSDSFDCVAG